MSDDFTYQIPDNEKYHIVLLNLLKYNKEIQLYELLKNAKCVINPSSSFSRNRWNAYYTTIFFYVSPLYDLNNLDFGEDTKLTLIRYCDKIMPKDAGYDVMNVEITPSLDFESGDQQSLEGDLEELSNSIGKIRNFPIPEDIKTKGKEMMEVYLYLYVIENYLRIFIEQISIDAYGNEYISNLNLTRSIKDMIKSRKQTEEKNRWVSIRGESELFYLDFIELSALITNNWELFSNYFPDQSWISSKLNDLYSIRNLVAHNSYVGEHERDILQVTFRSIVKQLNSR